MEADTRYKTNYWQTKFDNNKRRDRSLVRALRNAGWSVLVIWECELKDPEALVVKLSQFLSAEDEDAIRRSRRWRRPDDR